MYYLIGRDLDADGQYEFIQDMDRMILTEDPNRALQVTERELDYIDMDYLNAAGFYALEANRFRVNLLGQLLFSPLMRGFRPMVPPPPRRPRVRRPAPKPRPMHAPHPARPRAIAKAGRGRALGLGMDAPGGRTHPAGPGRRSGGMDRGPGGRGPGGRGPGR